MRPLKALVLSLALLLPVRADAARPSAEIQSTVEKVIRILKDPSLKSEAKKKERRAELRRVISSRFDFTEMAKRSLGSQWRRLTPQQREEFVQLFTDLLERAYVDTVESYNDEKFAYLKENLDDGYAEVESKIITRKSEEFSLNYRLHQVGGEWKVYDLVIENISLVNNYRSQFNRIMANSSYEELLRRLRQKQIEVSGAKK